LRQAQFIETSFERGRCFANELDLQAQLETWFQERANPRMHKTLRCRPSDRLIEERQAMAPLPAMQPDVDRRWVLRVPPDPYLRFDTCDYSLDPGMFGRRVEARIYRARGPRSRASGVGSARAEAGKGSGAGRATGCRVERKQSAGS
jgi:hypothetical protein